MSKKRNKHERSYKILLPIVRLLAIIRIDEINLGITRVLLISAGDSL